MKICISSQGSDLEADVDPRFGRCYCFIFVDTDTLHLDAALNDNAQGMGGVGIRAAQMVVDRGAKAVLTGNCGPNAFQALKAAGIEVFSGVSGKVGQAVEAYKKGSLKAAARSSSGPGKAA